MALLEDLRNDNSQLRMGVFHYRELFEELKRDNPLPPAGGWRDITDHPIWRGQPPYVLLAVPGWPDASMGQVYHFPDGSIITRVSHVNGDIGATKYHPLPALPSPPASDKETK